MKVPDHVDIAIPVSAYRWRLCPMSSMLSVDRRCDCAYVAAVFNSSNSGDALAAESYFSQGRSFSSSNDLHFCISNGHQWVVDCQTKYLHDRLLLGQAKTCYICTQPIPVRRNASVPSEGFRLSRVMIKKRTQFDSFIIMPKRDCGRMVQETPTIMHV
jgi:hypothetical protein